MGDIRCHPFESFEMNLDFFNFLNAFAGQSIFLDSLFVFGGEYLIYFLLAGTALFLLLRREGLLEKLIVIVGGTILAWGASQVINMFFHVARPFVELSNIQPLFIHGGFDSLPSGHATLAFALATGLFFYNKWLGGLFLFGALMIGLSRVVAGVHWPVDILGGALVGVLVVVVVHFFFKKIRK